MARILNYASSHKGFASQANLWFNPPVLVGYASGDVGVRWINERVAEVPYAFRSLSRVPRGGKILDVGATESTVCLSLATLGYEVTAIDPRPNPLSHERLRTVVGRIEDWQPNVEFDAVLCLSTIEHLGRGEYEQPGTEERVDLEAMKRIQALTMAGGLLVLTTAVGAKSSSKPSRVYDREGLDELLAGWKVEDLTLVQRTDATAWETVDEADRGPRSGDQDRGHGHGDQDDGLSASTIRVLFDIQALQNPWSAERGIGRYVHELGLALPGVSAELEPWFLLNRDLPVPPEMVAQFGSHGTVAYSDDTSLPKDAVYHVPSPLEPTKIDRLWPHATARPALRRDPARPDTSCLPGREHARRSRSARVLDEARAAAARRSGPERFAGDSRGRGPDAGSEAGADGRHRRRSLARLSAAGESHGREGSAAQSRSEIDREYVLFTGGMDYRKNVDGLLTAYAGLAKELRDRYQLVIVGRLGIEDPLGPFAELAGSLGVSDRVVLTGHVSEEELVLLYQGSSLFVFPSRYEGFGLPVIEALACGAPAIVGQNSSLVELVDHEEALFEADEPSSIQSALARALTNAELRERLRRPDVRERFTWSRVAELTVDVYRDLLGASPRDTGQVSRRR